MKLIRIQAWASARYEDPPSIYTLRRWARDGLFWPPAKKEGRDWWVMPNAQKLDRDDPILKGKWP